MSRHKVTGTLTVMVKYGEQDALEIQAIVQRRLERIREDLKKMGIIFSSVLVMTQPVQEAKREGKN